MTLREDLLRTIIEHPEDDAPRLVLADWLDENGEPERAELIRVQIELANIDATHPHRERLVQRVEALVKGRTKKWRAELPRLQGITWGDFDRGFIDSVVAHSAFRLRQHATRIAQMIPLKSVHLRPGLRRSLEALSKLPALTKLMELHLDHQGLSPEDLKPLLVSTIFGKLRVLNLSANMLGDQGAMMIAACDKFPSLKILDLTSNGIHGDGAFRLARSIFMQSIERLILDDNPLGTEDRETLMASHGKWISAANLSED